MRAWLAERNKPCPPFPPPDRPRALPEGSPRPPPGAPPEPMAPTTLGGNTLRNGRDDGARARGGRAGQSWRARAGPGAPRTGRAARPPPRAPRRGAPARRQGGQQGGSNHPRSGYQADGSQLKNLSQNGLSQNGYGPPRPLDPPKTPPRPPQDRKNALTVPSGGALEGPGAFFGLVLAFPGLFSGLLGPSGTL